MFKSLQLKLNKSKVLYLVLLNHLFCYSYIFLTAKILLSIFVSLCILFQLNYIHHPDL